MVEFEVTHLWANEHSHPSFEHPITAESSVSTRVQPSVFSVRCIKESSSEGNSWWLDLGDREVLDALPVAGHEVNILTTDWGSLILRNQ